MAKISNTISAIPGVLNKLVFVIYKTTDPGAEIARIVKDPPHVVPYNFEFNDLENGVYIVKIHESTDGVILGNLRHDYWVDATTGTFSENDRIFFSVDGADEHDPASDQSEYVNPDLDGVDITGVFMEGFRYLIPTLEWEPLPGGGIRILNRTFDNGQVWAVELEQVETGTSSPPPNDTFAGIDIKTLAAENLINSDLNKSLLCRAAGSNIQDVYMPFIAGIASGRGFYITHDGGTQINTTVRAQAGEFFRFRGQDVGLIHLGRGNFIKGFKATIGAETRWYITDSNGEWDSVGDVMYCDVNTGNNRIQLIGTQYDTTVYRRLGQYVSNLPPSQIVTFTQYDQFVNINGGNVYINRGFFAVNGNLVKVPNLMDRYLKFLKVGSDAERFQDVPGGYQHFEVGQINGNISVTLGNSFTGNPGGGWSQRPGKGESNPQSVSLPISLNSGKENDGINIAKLPMLQI